MPAEKERPYVAPTSPGAAKIPFIGEKYRSPFAMVVLLWACLE